MSYEIPPLILPEGSAIVFGDGWFGSLYNIVPPVAGLWGTIYGINGTTMQVGDTVLFDNRRIEARLAYNAKNYTIIKQDAVLLTSIEPPPIK